jgi:hypothetical protein
LNDTPERAPDTKTLDSNEEDKCIITMGYIIRKDRSRVSYTHPSAQSNVLDITIMP